MTKCHKTKLSSNLKQNCTVLKSKVVKIYNVRRYSHFVSMLQNVAPLDMQNHDPLWWYVDINP